VSLQLTNSNSHRVDLSIIPYVQNVPKDGRQLWLTTYFDCEKNVWQSYLNQNGKIQPFGFSKLVKGFYIAKFPACHTHIQFELSELAFQHFGMPNLQNVSQKLCNDISNALASIQKYFVLLNHVNHTQNCMDVSLVNTEIEYALTNHRSFYDLLNSAVSLVCERAYPRPKKLPESFREISQKSAEDLKTKYGLPVSIVNFYKEKEALFSVLRDARDVIVHHGHSTDSVFHFQDGFGYAVDRTKLSLLRNYGLWDAARLKPNDVGSLLELFAFLVGDMLKASQDVAQALRAAFSVLPEAVAPGFHLYFCSELNFHLQRLSDYRNHPWRNPESEFRP